MDDAFSYAREDCPRIHGVRSLMSYSSRFEQEEEEKYYDDDYMKFVNSHLTVFSCGELMVGMNWLGICIARDGQKRCCWRVLKAWLGFLAELEAFLYADHMRFDLAHLYIERLPTL